VKQNDPRECYSETEGVPYLEDGSESGDEQYGAQGCQAINSVAHNLGVDSTSSELGDAFSIQEDDIDSVFCDALEDHAGDARPRLKTSKMHLEVRYKVCYLACLEAAPNY
jgi:hypothetical protein